MMKRLPALLILLMLLCGCAGKIPAAEMLPTEQHADTQEYPGLYDPDSTLEASTRGALRCYPLGGDGGCGIYPLSGNRLLLITPGEDFSALTILEGDSLTPSASAHLNFPLHASDATLLPCGSGISFFDSSHQETVVLDDTLQEIRRISAPKDMVGQPLLSRDGSFLFYCTQDTIRSLELSSGISRVVKHSAHSRQTLTGLFLEDTAIACKVTEDTVTQTLLLSAQTGSSLYSCQEDVTITANDRLFFVTEASALLFGSPGAPLQALFPAESPLEIFFLPENHAAVSFSRSGADALTLAYYDLASGQRTGFLIFPTDTLPWGFQAAENGCVWFLCFDRAYGCNTLYRWDPALSPSGDHTVYTGLHFTRENPDQEALADCEAYAQEIGQRYGIEILIYQQADDVQPSGYRLEYEYLAQPTLRTLELLDNSLQRYPEGFLRTVSERFDAVSICLVRSIRGAPDWGTLDSTDGLQFWDGHHAYIALAVGDCAEGALYHQLCHLIDTVVLNGSSAYDTWQTLNPSGFRYDYSYITNRTRNSTAYLQEATRSFVDMFSMSFPKEDRARIMEYAMLPGMESLFQSRTMQGKLLKLCQGIREAFGLRKSPEKFPWEQYLHESLAYIQ